MKVRFIGPRSEIRTSTGIHRKGEVKEYSDAVGRELIETGVRNKFEEVMNAKEVKDATGETVTSQAADSGAETKSKAESKTKSK